MKYAKLKKGIISDLEHLWKDMNGNYCFGLGYKPVIYKEEIIKESDNIEDLFDEYVFENVLGKILNMKKFPEDCSRYYGAIWTDKGLIYVARMNKNGKWELI